MNSIERKAPIILFTYNRPIHVQKVVASLKHNIEASSSDLYVYSDAAKNETALKGVLETRDYLKTIDGFKTVTIIERERNWGLAANIIDGVTAIVNKYGSAIVLEDDHVVSPYFLKYMNEGLEKYKENERVASIHGYVYPCKKKMPEMFFIKGADCWSWATWKRAWDHFEPDGQKLLNRIRERRLEKEFDFGFNANYIEMLEKQVIGKNASWAVRWYASTFLDDMYTLYPGKSMMKMIGADGLGTHGAVTNKFDVELKDDPINFAYAPCKVHEDKNAKKAFSNFFYKLMSPKLKLYKLVCILFGKRIFIKRIVK